MIANSENSDHAAEDAWNKTFEGLDSLSLGSASTEALTLLARLGKMDAVSGSNRQQVEEQDQR